MLPFILVEAYWHLLIRHNGLAVLGDSSAGCMGFSDRRMVLRPPPGPRSESATSLSLASSYRFAVLPLHGNNIRVYLCVSAMAA